MYSSVHMYIGPCLPACKVAGCPPVCTECTAIVRGPLPAVLDTALSGFRGLNQPIKQYSVDNKKEKLKLE